MTTQPLPGRPDPYQPRRGYARADGSDTMHAAADAQRRRPGPTAGQVLDAFIDRHLGGGLIGATDDELEQLTGMLHQSASARRRWLCQYGFVEDSGLRRPTRSDSPAIVWVLTERERFRIAARDANRSPPPPSPPTVESLLASATTSHLAPPASPPHSTASATQQGDLMARTIPSPDNVLKTAINVTRFGGLNTGEKRRILAFEMPSEERAQKNPNLVCGVWSEFMHNLQADEVKAPEGHIVRERKWFGNYICLGDENVIREQRFDPANCPICAYAAQSEEFVPKRYHATNIIVYSTRPGSYDLVEPYSVQLLPWRMSETQFKQVADLWKEHVDLQTRDLLIECTAKQYQNYDIAIGSTAAWLDIRFNTGKQPGGTPKYGMDLRDIVLQTYRSNRLTDPELASVIATRAGAATMREKAQALAATLGIGASTGGAIAVPDQASQVMSPDDISAMLSQPSPGVATDQASQVAQVTNPQGGRTTTADVAESPQEPAISPDDLGVAPEPQAPPEPAQPAQAPQPASAPNSTPDEDPDIPTPEPAQQVSLDDLLAG